MAGRKSTLRVFVAILLFATYVVYVWKSAEKLRKGQLGMSVVPEWRNLFEVPSLTFCAPHQEEKKAAAESERRGYVVEKAFLTATPDGEDTKLRLIEVSPELHLRRMNEIQGAEPRFHWRRLGFFVEGLGLLYCDSFGGAPGWKMRPGMAQGISVRLDTSGIPAHLNRILYVVNHPDESPLMEGVGGGAHLMSGNAPSKDDGNQSVIMTFIQLSLGKLVYVSKNGRGCSKEHFGKFSKCLWKHVAAGHDCATDGDTSKCEEETGNEIYAYLTSLFSKAAGEVQDMTECLTPCEQPIYKVSPGKDVVRPRIMDENFTQRLDFYIPQPTFTIEEEYIVYDWFSFLADCGGMGGILLGFSMLSFFDWVSGFKLGRCCARIGRKEQGVQVTVIYKN